MAVPTQVSPWLGSGPYPQVNEASGCTGRHPGPRWPPTCWSGSGWPRSPAAAAPAGRWSVMGPPPLPSSRVSRGFWGGSGGSQPALQGFVPQDLSCARGWGSQQQILPRAHATRSLPALHRLPGGWHNRGGSAARTPNPQPPSALCCRWHRALPALQHLRVPPLQGRRRDTRPHSSLLQAEGCVCCQHLPSGPTLVPHVPQI